MVFLSIFLATCRPDNIVNFLQNLADTCSDPTNFEVLIKIDEGDEKTIAAVNAYQHKVPFVVKYLVTAKHDGYYSLHFGYNDLLKVADKNTYFCWLLTDEIKMLTQGWDALLKPYIGLYADDIFRLKLSVFQLKNYYDLKECLSCPDNYAVTTKKWLDITDGWGNFWGPDSWHQCVDYFLGLCKQPELPFAYYRSVPVFGIHIGGQEAGQTTNVPVLNRRMIMIPWGWNYHSTHKAQENYFRLALRLKAHIVASEQNYSHYFLIENPVKKTLCLLTPQKERIFEDTFRLPKRKIRFYIGNKQLQLEFLMFKFPWTTKLAFKVHGKLKSINRFLTKYSFTFFWGHFKKFLKPIVYGTRDKTINGIHLVLNFLHIPQPIRQGCRKLLSLLLHISKTPFFVIRWLVKTSYAQVSKITHHILNKYAITRPLLTLGIKLNRKLFAYKKANYFDRLYAYNGTTLENVTPDRVKEETYS